MVPATGFGLAFEPDAGSTFVDGAAPTSNLVAHLGEWGIDTGANTVWVVLDHNSQFAVVPEPATMAFLAIGGIGLIGGAIRPPSHCVS